LLRCWIEAFAGFDVHFEWDEVRHQKLHARGVKLALASSSNEDEVEYYTQLLGVGELLETSTSKRDSEVSQAIARKSSAPRSSASAATKRARWRPAIHRTREIERIDHHFSE
jgi:hypothetical protein